MTMIDVVVTKYDYTVDFLYEIGAIDDSTLVTDFASRESVVGKECFGSLPLHMVQTMAGLWMFDINLPKRKRGKMLSLDDLRKYVYGLSRYTAQRQQFDLEGVLLGESKGHNRPEY